LACILRVLVSSNIEQRLSSAFFVVVKQSFFLEN